MPKLTELTDAKSVPPLTLPPEWASTHVLRENHHDEAKTQLRCQWIDRLSDEVGEGRVIWYHPDGTISQNGMAAEGQAVGRWQHFRDDGSLSMIEDYRPDGGVYQKHFDHGVPTREGLRRKGPEGYFRDDGWMITYEDGKPRREDLYRMGDFLLRRAPLDRLEAALKNGVAKALSVSSDSPEDLYNGVEGLMEAGRLTLTPELALGLSQVSWDHTVPKAVRLLTAVGPAMLPALEAEVRTLMVADYPEGRHVLRLTLALSALTGPLAPTFDPLLHEALRLNERHSSNGKLVEALTAALSALPLERREALVMSDPAKIVYQRNQILWTYAPTAPTARVRADALQRIAGFKKSEFTYTQRKPLVEDTLRAFGPAGVPDLIAWLEGDGKKAAQRELVVRALAEQKASEAVPVLLAFADDSIDDVKRAAREGIEKLGALAIPGLEAAAAGKKGKVKATAEELLAVLKKGAEAPTDTVSDMPTAVKALEALRTGVSPEARARFDAVVTDDQRVTEANLNAALAIDAPSVLAALADRAKDNARGKGALRFDDFLHKVRWKLDTHPAMPALLAELLVAVPEKGNWNAKWLIPDRLPIEALAAYEPLGFYFEREVPETGKFFAAHMATVDAYAARRVLLACAKDSRKPIRTEGIAGLVRAGARVVPEVLPLLEGNDDGVLAAAEILRALPEPSAVAPLEAALAREKNKKRREALEETLAACRNAAGAATGAPADASAVDADLAARAAKRKKKAPVVPALPPMHWKNGTSVSAGAVQWLIAALFDEGGGGEPNAELTLVRQQLSDTDAAALFAAIDGAFGYTNDHKWKIYAAGVLGDDAALRALAKPLQSWASSGSHGLAAHAIEALRRNGTGVAIAWIDHWAEEGTGKLQREAKGALDRLCEARDIDRDGLVDLTTPRQADNEAAAIAEIAKRLEAAMIVGRKFNAEHLKAFVLEHPLVRKTANGLVFRDAAGALGVLGADGFTDAAGAAVALTAPLEIPHPCALTDEQLSAFQDALANLGQSQAFPQVARPFTREPDEGLAALADQTMPTRRMLGQSEKLGYRRGAPQDAGMVYEFTRTLAAGWILVLSHDGFAISDGRNPNGKDNVIQGIYARQRDDSSDEATTAMASEALEDLRKLLSPG